MTQMQSSRRVRDLRVAAGLSVIVAGIGAPCLAAENAAARGAQVYGQFCSQCHGANMVNSGGFAFDLRIFPADQHDRFTHSVMNGKGAMPAWEGTVTPAQTEDLWSYVSTARTGPAASSKE